MVRIYIYILYFSSFPISTRYSSLPSVGPHTLFSSCCKLQFLHLLPTQALAQCRERRLISSFSAPISLLSHFSSTLSLNLSPSQTPRPMIADRGWVRCRNGLWVVSVLKRLVLFFPHLHSAAGFGLLGSWCVVAVWVSWLGYLEGEISGFFFFFFQLVASFLVELEATVMVVVVWLCRDGGGGFCCGFVFFVWFGLRKKIEDLGWWFFFFFPAVDCWWW